MSLFDLKSLVSNEDFADAHEPLNDGVKEVPNAQTVAASVKTGDVGKDTTSQGPAKVVPEKPDTDDQTKTEHNTVKESAEKPGAKPAAPAASPKSPETKEDSGDSTDKPAKPFEPKEPADETDDVELEHTTEKAAKDDLEKTEKATKGLEAYSLKARRFDIIGHPKVQAAEVGKMISYLNRRAGITGDITISSESVDAAIAVGQARIARLEREAIQLNRKVSTEDISDSMGIDNAVVEEAIVTAAPTEHGAPPLAPEAAAALTEQEINPLDVPLLEIDRVAETIQTLETGAAAVEQYRQLIKANPRMSKQAAAVLQAGLEHIDRMCELKVRTTGMEGYLTTPRAAMEEAEEVKEKSLGDRAAEIGKKILEWIKQLVEKAADSWGRFRTGLDKLKDQCMELSKQKFNKEGTTVLRPAPQALFMEGEFFGDWPTPDEETLAKNLSAHYTKLTNEVKRRVGALLRDKEPQDIIMVMEALRSDDTDKTLAELPGPHWVVSEAGRLKLGEGKPDAPEEHSVENSEIQPDRLLKVTARILDELVNLDVVSMLRKSSEEVTQGLIKYRKGHGKDIDESEFQKVQTAVVDNSIKLFDIQGYFEILKYVGGIANARYKLCASLANKG